MTKAKMLEDISCDDDLIEVGRKAVENALVGYRNSRLSAFARSNGLVIREPDGTDSSVIRFGPEVALQIGLRAIASAIKAKSRKRS